MTYIELQNDGALPNDSINSIEAKPYGEYVEVSMSIDSVAADATHRETTLIVRCIPFHIEDPSRPGQKIRVNCRIESHRSQSLCTL